MDSACSLKVRIRSASASMRERLRRCRGCSLPPIFARPRLSPRPAGGSARPAYAGRKLRRLPDLATVVAVCRTAVASSAVAETCCSSPRVFPAAAATLSTALRISPTTGRGSGHPVNPPRADPSAVISFVDPRRQILRRHARKSGVFGNRSLERGSARLSRREVRCSASAMTFTCFASPTTSAGPLSFERAVRSPDAIGRPWHAAIDRLVTSRAQKIATRAR